nr:hypothetical protein HUO10_006451 [Paraburkholderia busanensis]
MATTLYVQFSDSTQNTIISYFASEQNESTLDNLGTVLSTDERWATFYNAVSGVKGMPAPDS